jgi:hypothetical protein
MGAAARFMTEGSAAVHLYCQYTPRSYGHMSGMELGGHVCVRGGGGRGISTNPVWHGASAARLSTAADVSISTSNMRRGAQYTRHLVNHVESVKGASHP